MPMAASGQIKIRKIDEDDRPWMKNLWVEHWGGDFVITRGKIIRLGEVDGFIAEMNGQKVGLITYKIDGGQVEIMSMNSLAENKGIGTSLVKAALDVAGRNSVKRVMLITTNDNLNALRFWQKRGFSMVRVYPNAMENTRRLKPGIPLVGENDIPLRDEIELERLSA